MRVPTRKPGKYTGLKPDPCLTPAKYRELSHKLEKLKASRPFAIQEVKRLAADGDFSENHAYSLAKGRLRGLNQRVDEITDHLKRVVIIESPKNNGMVVLGCLVTVETNGPSAAQAAADKQKTYRILGSSETDPGSGVISHNSPLGRALMGKCLGDTAAVRLKDRIVEYKIIKIE